METQRACVPDDVVEDDQPLKLQLQQTVSVLRQGIGFEPPQPEVCVLVAVHKELERADLYQWKYTRVIESWTIGVSISKQRPPLISRPGW